MSLTDTDIDRIAAAVAAKLLSATQASTQEWKTTLDADRLAKAALAEMATTGRVGSLCTRTPKAMRRKMR